MRLAPVNPNPHAWHMGIDGPFAPAHQRDMLSSKAKYAVRAVLCLADRASSGEWTQAADVAEQEQIPRKFLEAILVQLRDHDIVESRRGAQGGHRLGRDPAAISVADVIRVVDGPLALTPCASRTRFRQCIDCVDFARCRLQPLMQQARDAVAGVLENCSLAALAEGHTTDIAALPTALGIAPPPKRKVRAAPRRRVAKPGGM
ncbi:MAG: Rrf2 family transcriptional regulator [Acetobacteraceae bacterium]|nr:Rrf2 family transcriptional regulator [Acetobacteraceae bacterium]